MDVNVTIVKPSQISTFYSNADSGTDREKKYGQDKLLAPSFNRQTTSYHRRPLVLNQKSLMRSVFDVTGSSILTFSDTYGSKTMSSTTTLRTTTSGTSAIGLTEIQLIIVAASVGSTILITNAFICFCICINRRRICKRSCCTRQSDSEATSLSNDQADTGSCHTQTVTDQEVGKGSNLSQAAQSREVSYDDLDTRGEDNYYSNLEKPKDNRCITKAKKLKLKQLQISDTSDTYSNLVLSHPVPCLHDQTGPNCKTERGPRSSPCNSPKSGRSVVKKYQDTGFSIYVNQ